MRLMRGIERERQDCTNVCRKTMRSNSCAEWNDDRVVILAERGNLRKKVVWVSRRRRKNFVNIPIFCVEIILKLCGLKNG